MTQQIDAIVAECYENSCENGYQAEMEAQSDESWAAELMDYTDRFEDYTHEQVVEAVRRFRATVA